MVLVDLGLTVNPVLLHLVAIPPAVVCHCSLVCRSPALSKGALHQAAVDGPPPQKLPKAFLLPLPAGITRSTLKRTVLDSGLWADVREGKGPAVSTASPAAG